jgi:hypothetical protein
VQLIQNNPRFRAVIYVAAIVLQLAAYATRAADKSGAWGDAVQDAANFVATLAGVTAVTNLSKGTPSA